ncbi:MAG: hypothetical protein AAF288_06210 [Planctomycetota bacterium]
MDRGKLPTSLIAVAVLFIVGGVFSVLEVLVSLANSRININFGVLGLFIGPGLLRLSRGWRTCALVFIWITLIAVPLFALLLIAVDGPLDYNVFGQKFGHASKAWGLVIVAIVFAIALWEYRVLTRPDVRRLFGLDGA